MPKNNFISEFGQHSVSDWEKIAQQELGNKNPWENLTRTKQGTTIKPYYDSANAVAEKKISLSYNTLWRNVPKVIAYNDKKASEEALVHLNEGADGVWFDIQHPVKVKVLLNKIELPYCSVYLSSRDDSQFTDLADYVESKSWADKVTGAFYYNELKPHHRFKQWKNFHPYGIAIKENENIVDEIVDSLLMTVELIEKLIAESFSLSQAFQSIAFSISVNTDFFLSIAKIRALKNLWFTLQEAYQISNPISPSIHAHSRPWIKDGFQPHGNMLKQTTAAMAAAISGCNAITIEPETSENKTMTRIARNVSPMLNEESHLAKVSDPLAGSFYVETLTHQIASEAWEKFQQR